MRLRRAGRWLLLVALVLSATLVSPGSVRAAPSGPPTDGIIEVVGSRGGSAEFSLAQPATLLAFQNAFTRRPFFERKPYVAGTTTGDFVGWYLQRLPDEKPIAGFLTVPAFDRLMGAPLPLGLVPDWPETLEPGRYRVVLLADGPSRAFIRTAEPWAGQVLQASTPHPVAASGVLGWSGPASSASSPFDFADPTSLLLEFGFSRTDATGAETAVTCLTPAADSTCAQSATVREPNASGGFHSGGPGSWGAGASLRVMEPGEIAPGAYNFVLHGAGVSSAGGALLIGIADAGNPWASAG